MWSQCVFRRHPPLSAHDAEVQGSPIIAEVPYSVCFLIWLSGHFISLGFNKNKCYSNYIILITISHCRVSIFIIALQPLPQSFEEIQIICLPLYIYIYIYIWNIYIYIYICIHIFLIWAAWLIGFGICKISLRLLWPYIAFCENVWL